LVLIGGRRRTGGAEADEPDCCSQAGRQRYPGCARLS
jgi:hypothetical protein